MRERDKEKMKQKEKDDSINSDWGVLNKIHMREGQRLTEKDI